MPERGAGTWPGDEWLHCGVDAGEHGPVVGCCHVCGLLLCEAHAHHLPRARRFGLVDGVGAAPLVCGNHRRRGGQAGLPPRESRHPRKRTRRRTLLDQLRGTGEGSRSRRA